MVESVQFDTTRWTEIGTQTHKRTFAEMLKARLRESMCVCRPIWLNPDDVDAA